MNAWISPAAIVAAVLFVAAPALPATPPPEPLAQNVTIHYTASLRPNNSFRVPYSGALVLTFTPENRITGTYRPRSVRPDPLNGRIISVLGGRRGNDVNLAFGTGLGFSVRGTIQPDGRILASGFASGTKWDFEAVPSGN